MKKEVLQVITTLFTAFGQEDKRERIRTYCELLNNVNIKALKVAAYRCIDNYKFLPTVAEIKTELRQIQEQVTGDRSLDWDEAWQEIQSKMGSVGPYRKPEWSTPEIAQVVKSIGWTSLCETPNSEIPIVRAQMKVMYEQCCKREVSIIQTKNILQGKSGFESIDTAIKMLTDRKENTKDD